MIGDNDDRWTKQKDGGPQRSGDLDGCNVTRGDAELLAPAPETAHHLPAHPHRAQLWALPALQVARRGLADRRGAAVVVCWLWPFHLSLARSSLVSVLFAWR